MLLANVWETDSRVIREANALAHAGYDVHVICNQRARYYYEIEREGVIYHCLAAPANRTALRTALQYLWQTTALCRVAFVGMQDRRTLMQALRRIALLALQWLAFIPLLPFVAPILPVALRSEDGGFRSSFFIRLTRNWLQLGAISYLNQFSTKAAALAKHLRPTVVHAHDLVTLSTGYMVAKSAGAKLVYDAHELETHTNYWNFSGGMRSWVALYEEVLCRKADAVITVCDSIADWLRDRYEIARPVVVHNSPDIAASSGASTKVSLRTKLGLANNVPLAVYVGSVTVDRGIEQCIEALAYAPELHMAFVGPRYSETEAHIVALSQQLNLEARIHLVDPVPTSEVVDFISDADCSVMAIQNVCLSYYFCFPNKLLESVLGGVPVVTARLFELESFVRRFRVGLIADETDPRSLAVAIQTVIRRKEDFRPDVPTRNKIIGLYGWPTQRQRLLRLYNELLGQDIEITDEFIT